MIDIHGFLAGATLYKCINRVGATCLAGALGLGVHWIASKSGERFEPYILLISVFFLGMFMDNFLVRKKTLPFSGFLVTPFLLIKMNTLSAKSKNYIEQQSNIKHTTTELSRTYKFFV